MKQLIIAIVLIASLSGLLLLSSCDSARGNGKVVTDLRRPQAFTRLVVNGTFPVVLSQDTGGPWVKVVTDENLQDLVELSSNGDELTIGMIEKSSIKSKEFKVYVNVDKLTEINYKSVGGLSTKGILKLDSLQLTSESVGKLNIGIDADYLRANLDNVGSTTLHGKVRETRINTQSVGALHAFDLKAQHLMLHNKAVGRAEIYADSTLRIRSSAVGTVSYKGHAEVLELSNEGVGKVKHID